MKDVGWDGVQRALVGRLPVRILETSLSLRGMKEGKDELLTVAPLGEGDSWSNCCPMAATFSVKKEAKLSAVRSAFQKFLQLIG